MFSAPGNSANSPAGSRRLCRCLLSPAVPAKGSDSYPTAFFPVFNASRGCCLPSPAQGAPRGARLGSQADWPPSDRLGPRGANSSLPPSLLSSWRCWGPLPPAVHRPSSFCTPPAPSSTLPLTAPAARTGLPREAGSSNLCAATAYLC